MRAVSFASYDTSFPQKSKEGRLEPRTVVIRHGRQGIVYWSTWHPPDAMSVGAFRRRGPWLRANQSPTRWDFVSVKLERIQGACADCTPSHIFPFMGLQLQLHLHVPIPVSAAVL